MTENVQEATATEPQSPDWDTIDETIPCPLCEYDLRRLPEPRCPECGYRFDWPEVMDPKRRWHPYLFEHHPEHNIKSFFQTAKGSLRPRRFFSSLHPTQPSRPGRMLIYWFVGLVVLGTVLVLSVATFLFATICLHATKTGVAGGMPWRAFSLSSLEMLAAIVHDAILFIPLVLALAAWAWGSFAALLIFQISMRRARIKTVHVLRCVLYSFDSSLAIMALSVITAVCYGLAIIAWFIPDPSWFISLFEEVTGPLLLTCLGLLIIAIYRLTVAYRLYLRFDHPILTILASQIIVVLLAANLSFWLGFLL